MARIAVVGAGAAGLMAAGFAAERHEVVLVERNARPGRKLMITGKGRCNVTNNCGLDEFLANVPVNPRFLYSALSQFGPADAIAFFEKLGVPLKTERGRRVFPVSDKAVEIVDALARFAAPAKKQTGRVQDLLLRGDAVAGVRLEDGREIGADAVILCTGGASYPATGSTGDGYHLAEQAGHTIVPPHASLVPMVTEEEWPARVMGLSLRNVTLTVCSRDGKTVFSELGEMLFTHFGVSGPLVLAASSHLRKPQGGRLSIDLKPGLSPEKLDARLQRDFEAFSAQNLSNTLHALLPARLISICLLLAHLDGAKKTAQVTRAERLALGAVVKALPLTVKAFRPIEEAIITSGGVNVREVDPKTMASKRKRGLYIAGELLDVDAHTGGYNLQIAFATGRAAGLTV
ncbi:NAD(P)/FAD-dependent oxidoreductase [Ethanoligenens harbinense]|uniref:HI0933 family protein n=1 Tax=Ethanoligenens harbinense (strain DSM 18485 / JCM 12961 / CGMCC 1.5033 / YUAN-3) TaxID=663278 RepID=E6U7H5_ETHHY|nr:NAD(P)/FAD-dependent oxidoreductase [Ethanoligenens harbinense]ADU26998.1 HI0933 family protein [Ethanoligenens harbinense YUAN-3]